MPTALKAALATIGIAGMLLIVRAQMVPFIAAWAAENRPLSLPQRLIAGIAENALGLIALTVVIAVLVVLRDRGRDRSAP